MNRALAARLLNQTPETLLQPRPGSAELLAQLFESLATLTVRAAAQTAEARLAHLRTRDGGREIDGDVRQLTWLADQIGPRLVDRVVLTTGRYAYRRRDGIAVVPLALLG